MRMSIALLMLYPLVGCVAPAPAPSNPVPAPTTAPAGDFEVVTGFAEQVRGGTAGGSVENTTTCRGFYPSHPQHTMTLTENMLAMAVEVDTPDVILWIRSGKNNWCSTDSTPLPRVARGAWSQGTYEILVGTRSPGGGVPYNVRVSEGL